MRRMLFGLVCIGSLIAYALHADPLPNGSPPVNTSVTGTSFDKKAPVCSLTSFPAAVSNTAAETAFGATCTVPANSISAGNALHIHVGGLYSAGVAQSATGKVKVTTGAPVPASDTTILSTGAVGGLANTTGQEWYGDVWLTYVSATAFDAQGALTFQTGANAVVTVPLSNTSTYAYDPTQPFVLYLTVTWGAAMAANSMTLRTMVAK